MPSLPTTQEAILYQLVEKIRAGKPIGRPGRPPELPYPDQAQRQYEQLILRELRETRKLVNEKLLSNMPAVFAQYRREHGLDSWSDILENYVEDLRHVVEVKQVNGERVYGIANSVNEINANGWKRRLSISLGVTIEPNEQWLAGDLNAWSDANVRRIKDLNMEYADAISRAAQDAAMKGQSQKQLAEFIRERVDETYKNRAKIIARDQVATLNGNLMQFRQREAGVDRYIWRTSLDDRVRDAHVQLEGQVFRWNDPPEEGHPGEPIHCRCWADPVFDELHEKTIDKL